jgi:hypothetical protein
VAKATVEEAVKVTSMWRTRTRAVGSGAAAASDMAVGRRTRRGEVSGRAVGTGWATVGTWTQHGPNSAFMARRVRAWVRGSHTEVAC